MLFQDEETARLRRLLETEARALNRGELRWMLDLAKQWKPFGYDAHIAGLRRRYEGDQVGILEEALADRYPTTHDLMPRAPLNWVRWIASQDAGVYKLPPDRWLVGRDGEPLEDDARHGRFLSLLERARLAVVLPEAERRAMAARSVFVHAVWDQYASRPRVDLYWPDDVQVIPHPSAPTELDRALALLARTAGPGGVGEEWYQVWRREVEEDEDGLPVAFGPWRVEQLSLSGNATHAAHDPLEYEGTLPWVIYRNGIPAGSPFLDEDRDLPAIVDALNVSRSNELYVTDLQGHDQMYVAGHQTEASELAVGPDVLLRIGAGEQAGVLSFAPKLQDMREGRKLQMRELASSRRNSPDAYVTEPTAAISGVSRAIANIPHEEALEEYVEYARAFEAELLPLLVEVHDTFSGEERIGFEGLGYHMEPQRRPLPEDPEARQRRSLEAMREGLITPARAAVEAGWYRSVDDAVKGGLSDELEREPPPAPGSGGRLSELLAQRLAGRSLEPDPRDGV